MIHLIVGAPGAGKTTYVQQHQRTGDLVIDYDAIRATTKDATTAYRLRALAEQKAQQHDRDVWIVRTLARPEDREHFIQKHNVSDVVVLDPGVDICKQRVLDRDGNTDKFAAVERWYPHNNSGVNMSDTSQTENTTVEPVDGAQTAENTEVEARDVETSEEPQKAAEEVSETEGNKGNNEAMKYRLRLREAEAQLEEMKQQLQTLEDEKSALEENRAAQETQRKWDILAAQHQLSEAQIETLQRLGFDVDEYQSLEGGHRALWAVQQEYIDAFNERTGVNVSLNISRPQGLPAGAGNNAPIPEPKPNDQLAEAMRFN